MRKHNCEVVFCINKANLCGFSVICSCLFFKMNFYSIINRFTRCTVLTPLPLSFATSRIEYPLRSKLITSLYSVFICSVVFIEPTLRPSFPPFSIYLFVQTAIEMRYYHVPIAHRSKAWLSLSGQRGMDVLHRPII